MSDIPDLIDWLKAQPDTFETKKKLLFTSVIHKPTGEKVIEGYRYFATDTDAVIAAFETGDIAALQALPYALDEDGRALAEYRRRTLRSQPSHSETLPRE